ncbi:MAG: hypothetical protein M3Y30_02600 [Gemmatimonadota bacterium]|nr:hypothetical protein [Gemmatimonadota bacterium]
MALIMAVAVVISAAECASGGKTDPNDQARADSIRKAKQDSAGKTDTIHLKHDSTLMVKPPQ